MMEDVTAHQYLSLYKNIPGVLSVNMCYCYTPRQCRGIGEIHVIYMVVDVTILT